jgi:TRAP-type mannitol/chloroaromatic compound transport system permease small subunit
VPSPLIRLADILDRINIAVGWAVAPLLLVMALVQVAVVLMRYVFGAGSLWAQESVTYLHGTVFLLAAGYTAVRDGHVRVSIWYDRASTRTRAAIDLFGAVTMLLPFAAIVLYESIPYVRRSWAILEGSRESAGIPGVFLLKSLIIGFAVLLAFAGISQAIRCAARLSRNGAEA